MTKADQSSFDPFFEYANEERLMQTVSTGLGQTAEELRKSVIKSIRTFMDGTSQFDDITLIILKHEI